MIPVRASDDTSWTRLSMGRAEDNDLVVDDPAVSERHCFIKQREDHLVVGDLGSTNGTLINAERIKPPMLLPLKDQDILTLGRVSFQLFLPKTLYLYLQLCPT
jgi:pSer/pThr/pTyr-binding forkhead associated (FHA) protein